MGMEKVVAGKSLKESEKMTVFECEWKNLGQVGARGVAEHLKEKHGLKASPTVVDGGEEPVPVFSVSHEKFTHEFRVGKSRYHYVRVNGKAEERFKEFSALTTEFWVEFQRKEGNIDKRTKAKTTKQRDDASYKVYLQKQKDKKEAKKKEEEEAKKREAEEAKKREEEEAKKEEEEEAREREAEEAKKKETPQPPVNGEAASGETLPEE